MKNYGGYEKLLLILISRRLECYAAIGVELDAARGPSVVDTEEVQRKARARIKAIHPDKAGATTGLRVNAVRGCRRGHVAMSLLVHIYVIQINNEDITSEGRSRNHNL